MKIELILKSETVENKKTHKIEEKIIESKTYFLPRARGTIIQRLFSVQNILNEAGENFGSDEFNLMVDFICLAFGSQFTSEEFLEGIHADDILPKFNELCDELGNKTVAKINQLVKN